MFNRATGKGNFAQILKFSSDGDGLGEDAVFVIEIFDLLRQKVNAGFCCGFAAEIGRASCRERV